MPAGNLQLTLPYNTVLLKGNVTLAENLLTRHSKLDMLNSNVSQE